jgi:ribonuclease D
LDPTGPLTAEEGPGPSGSLSAEEGRRSTGPLAAEEGAGPGLAPAAQPRASVPAWEVVDTEGGLRRLVEQLCAAPRYAVDTEFHRERTYWPRLALVQVAWEKEPGAEASVALVDPLAVSLSPLAKVLEGKGEMVAHAASQDLLVLERACGALPSRLFDTQVAAGFLGAGPASLSSLVERFLGVKLAKADRLTDWSRRPLSESQLAYAAADAGYLIALADEISLELRARGRLSWAEEECAALLARPLSPPNPEEAWWRLKDRRHLQGASRGVAQEVAAWRERKARELDVLPRSVLPDLALVSIAHSPPTNLAALRELRGVEARHLRGQLAEELLAAVARGRSLPHQRLRVEARETIDKRARPAVALASAWVAQLSRDEEVDAALLATRDDIVEFLSGKPGARLGQGWRAQLVGVPLRRLFSGHAALYLGSDGRVRLEERLPSGAVGKS